MCVSCEFFAQDYRLKKKRFIFQVSIAGKLLETEIDMGLLKAPIESHIWEIQLYH